MFKLTLTLSHRLASAASSCALPALPTICSGKPGRLTYTYTYTYSYTFGLTLTLSHRLASAVSSCAPPHSAYRMYMDLSYLYSEEGK